MNSINIDPLNLVILCNLATGSRSTVIQNIYETHSPDVGDLRQFCSAPQKAAPCQIVSILCFIVTVDANVVVTLPQGSQDFFVVDKLSSTIVEPEVLAENLNFILFLVQCSSYPSVSLFY